MTRQYFSDHKNQHSYTEDMNIVHHPKTGEKDRRSLLEEKYQKQLLDKATKLLSNRRLLTYLGSALAIGLIVGTASAMKFRQNRRRSTLRSLNKWISNKF